MTIASTIKKLAELQQEIDRMPADQPGRLITLAGLEGLRADLITELYAECGHPEALPAAQVRFERRQVAQEIAAELTTILNATRSPLYRGAIARAITVVRVIGGR